MELQGEGEPFLHPGFLEMIEMAKRTNPDVHVSAITNGSLLSETLIQRLLDLQVQKLYISIESADADTFREIRGGHLNTVILGVQALMEARRRRGAQFPSVGFAVTVLRRTVHEFPAVVALYEKLGLDGGVTIQGLQKMPAYSRNYGEDMKREVLSRQDVADLRRLASDNAKTVEVLNRPQKVSGFYEALYAGRRKSSGICPWLEKGLYVNVDGLAARCCYMKEPGRDGFGALKDTTVAQIIEKRQALHEQLQGGIIPEGCQGCSLAKRIAPKGTAQPT
jgi:MoaA/NifB/PqqE/SkfB family radical SAM enzyme